MGWAASVAIFAFYSHLIAALELGRDTPEAA